MPNSTYFYYSTEIWQEKGDTYYFLGLYGKAYSSIKSIMQAKKKYPETKSLSTYIHLNVIEPDGL